MSDRRARDARSSSPRAEEHRHKRRRSNRDDSNDVDSNSRRQDQDYSRSRHHRRHRRSASVSDTEDRRETGKRERSTDRSRRDDGHDRPQRRRERERSPKSSRSRSPKVRRHRRSLSRSPPRKSRGPLPSQNEAFGGEKRIEGSDAPPPEKQKPNYKPTGFLAKEANTISGTTTVLKYHEPPEGRKPPPKQAWRMYVFKQKDLLETLHLHQRSVWLVGRDQHVADLPLEHPSISKQHAVVQFRYVTSVNEYGEKSGKVKPYLIDLESANGTLLNGEKVDASRFVELVDGDVVKFGQSEREYVLMLPPPDV